MGTRGMVVKLLEDLKDCKDIHDVNMAAGELWLEATKPKMVPGLALIVMSGLILASFIAGAFGVSHGPISYTGREFRELL